MITTAQNNENLLDASEAIRQYNEAKDLLEKKEAIQKVVNSLVTKIRWSNDFYILAINGDSVDLVKGNKSYRLMIQELES